MQGNYFYIDGSALTAQTRQLWRAEPSLRGRKLCPRRFIDYLIDALPDLHSNEYKRITFYFPRGDEAAIEDFLALPDHKRPGEVRDLHFKFCGYKLKKSAEFDKFVEEHVPPKFHDRFAKSEKGIDIEICCDALKLASASRVDRLFLFSNDGDFIPFCRALKEFGANISIIHLSPIVNPNGDLLREADSYDVVPNARLQELFLARPEPMLSSIDSESAPLESPAGAQPPSDKVLSEKPDAAPSDLDAVKDIIVEQEGPAALTEKDVTQE
jgi:uncharacterized LabA/DUF88 family protein